MDQMHVEVIEGPIQTEAVDRSLGNSSHGAQLVFFGAVRDHNVGKKVLSVSYDAFVPLALTIFREICAEANAQWGPALKIVLIHRIGCLKVGEKSVAIGVSAPHRDEAYQASRYVIENLKHRAPIWKKETYEDGESEWLRGHALCGHSSGV